MKFSHTLYLVTCTILSLGITACDDFLERQPIDQVSDKEYFRNEQNAEAAVNGAYRTITSAYSYGQTAIVIPEFASGHLNHVSSFAEYVEYEEFRILITNPWALNLWNASYATINAANNIIKYVPGISQFSSEEKRNQLINEAKFIRAMTYFTLVRSFGEVPLVLEPITSTQPSQLNVSRAPVAEVYDLIITDLEAATTLPAAYSTVESTKGRATEFAAKALLAKVYLYQGQYDLAAGLAKDVIDNGGFTLVSNFNSIWLNENTNEAIFELQFDAQAQNSLASNSNPASTQMFFAKKTTFKLFEDDDIRRAFSINLVINEENDTTFYIGKYRNFNPATQNVPIIRLAEVYLIYAEAQARETGSPAGEPYNHYLAVRDRAQVDTEAAGTFTLQSFITEIQFEKRREMLFEGESWYDFTRTGLAIPELGVPNEGRFLFPIPQSQRDLNRNLSQNDAYL